MEVTTDSERAVKSQKMVLELLMSDMPEKRHTLNSELDQWAAKLQIGKPRFEARHQPQADLSHHGIAVNLDSCIQCTRCVRACREEQVNDVIGYAFRGEHSKIVFDIGDPMGESTCVACGECVQACPTGALMPARDVGLVKPDKQVHSVCPFCGVGCQLTYNIKDNKIISVDGRDGPSNHNRLCVKGRYGFDYAHHPQRLTKPLIAAVEGPAIAGGTEILQGTDIRVAGESAKFGISEAKWSLYPMGGSAVRLVRQIPYTIACELLLTGRHITATEALAMGLIGLVVPDGQALVKALEIAEVISNNGPLAVQAILRSIRETEGMHENDAFKIDTKIGIEVFLSEDAKEGPLAFKEKRAPQFKMR